MAKASSETSSDPWHIYVMASSPRIDFEGERVLPQALRDGADYFLRRGVVTYEHLTPTTRYNPEVIIGHPTDIRFTSDGRTLVAALLYKHQPNAAYVYNILQSGGRLGASIGGAILERDDLPGKPSIISKIWFNHLAITAFPVNDDTDVQLTPYHEFIHKALGVASAAPLVMEDLQGARQRGTPAFLQRWRAAAALLRQRFPSLTADEAHDLALLLLTKRGETRQAYTPGALAPLNPEPRGVHG